MKAAAATKRLLLCAPSKWEAQPIARRLKLAATAAGQWNGPLADRSVDLIQTGMGPEKTASRLAAISRAESFDFVLSVGLAGALQPDMKPGDIALDVRGIDFDLLPQIRGIAAEMKLGLHFGRFIHSDTVLATGAQKAALGDRERASAVDMESKAIKQWAESRGLPCLVARVVLDAREDRVLAELPEGEDVPSLLRYARRNLAELPLMLRLGRRQKRGMANLSRFLVEFLPKL